MLNPFVRRVNLRMGMAERQILPLHIARASLIGVGIAADWDYLRADDCGGRVALYAFARGAIDLDELGVVDAHSETVFDRVRIRSKTIAGKLETAISGFAELLSEG